MTSTLEAPDWIWHSTHFSSAGVLPIFPPVFCLVRVSWSYDSLFLSLCLMNNPVIAAKLQTTLADRLLQCCGQCGPNCSTDRLYTKLSIWCTLASNFRRFLGCKLIPSSSTLFHMSQDALWCPCNLALTFVWMTASSEVVTNSINLSINEYQDSWDSFVTHSSLMHIICLDQNISFL